MRDFLIDLAVRVGGEKCDGEGEEDGRGIGGEGGGGGEGI